jgi:uncharacterized membrane protein
VESRRGAKGGGLVRLRAVGSGRQGPWRTPGSLPRGVAFGLLDAAVFLAAALYVGWLQGRFWAAVPLVGSALLLEAQPATVLSLALGFPPLAGAAISVLGNLAPLPFMALTFQALVRRWPWVDHRLRRAQRLARRYGHYGLPVLVLLSPFLGAYACAAIGYAMGWPRWPTLGATVVGMVGSVLLIAYGGHWVAGLFTHRW